MAKTKAAPKAKGAKAAPTEVVVTYDLFDLPTAYHKAGLAGLVLVIESLKGRKLLTEETAKYTMTPTCVTVTFTEPMVLALMDDVYDAELTIRKDKKAGSSAKAKSGDDDDKKAKNPPPDPKLKALEEMLPDGNPLWIKLWREMIFQGPRSQPTTWLPYKDRAAGRPYCKPKRNPWADLLIHKELEDAGQVATSAISGSL